MGSLGPVLYVYVPGASPIHGTIQDTRRYREYSAHIVHLYCCVSPQYHYYYSACAGTTMYLLI